MLVETKMNTLATILLELGLMQYYGQLVDAGYESWEDLLNITEADLYVASVAHCEGSRICKLICPPERRLI